MENKEIRIACVENMNNNMFSLTRHLQHLGYDTKLILTSELSHFSPNADTFELVDSQLVLKTDIVNADILNLDKIKIKEFFSQFNFIIACGFSVAYLTAAGISIDVIIPYGSDLYELPFFEPNDSHNIYFNAQRKIISLYQKLGIENAKAILFDYTNEDFETVIKKFNLKGIRHKLPAPFIYTPEFNVDNVDKLRHKGMNSKKMEAILAQFEFIIFNHGRQSWKNPADEWSYKGNERVFGAFKTFLEQTNAKACLIVFEYGTDVEYSKLLCAELGIESNVIWFPLTKRKDIIGMISYADVGVGEIGNHSWFSYGSIYEFLCMKKPVIHHRNDEKYIGKVGSLYPMYSASDELEVLAALKDCFYNKSKADTIAKESHKWYLANAIEKPLEVIESVIRTKDFKIHNFSTHFSLEKSKITLFIFYIKINLKIEARLNKAKNN